MKCLLSLLMLAVCCIGCTNIDESARKDELRELATRFVPSDARDQQEAEGIPWVQISFDVTRAPDEFAIPMDELKEAQRDGWLLCQPKESRWTEFEDLRLQPSRYIAEQSYMLHKDNTLLVLLGTYEYENEAAWKHASQMAAAKLVQHALVIAQPSSEKDARTRASDQRLQCNDQMDVH